MSRQPKPLDLLVYGTAIVLVLAADRLSERVMRYLLFLVAFAAASFLMAFVALLLFKPRK